MGQDFMLFRCYRETWNRPFVRSPYRLTIRSKNLPPVSVGMARSRRNRRRSNHLAVASIQHRIHCIDKTTDMHQSASFHLRYDRIQDM